jgi:copper chaperone NosL
MKKLHPATRILLAIAALSPWLAGTSRHGRSALGSPVSRGPGNMQIWLDDITGDFDMINGLNHYIGMREIEVETVSRIQFMKAMLLGFIFIGAAAGAHRTQVSLGFVPCSFIGRRRSGDFWYWSREFGHNLDPKAAISVPA